MKTILGVLVLVALAAAIVYFPRSESAPNREPTATPAAASQATSSQPADAAVQDDLPAQRTGAAGQVPATLDNQETTRSGPDNASAFAALQGSWQRTDGDYVLEIASVDKDGETQAAYYNPRPINVAKAKAEQDGDTTRVFVELRDAGYPGCIYQLQYHPQEDRLDGIYFQAAEQQKYDVTFVRAK